jgi:hypothetical protein
LKSNCKSLSWGVTLTGWNHFLECARPWVPSLAPPKNNKRKKRTEANYKNPKIQRKLETAR